MSLVVRTGPQEYISETGILEKLPQKLIDNEVKKVVIVHGEESWRKAQPFLQELFNSSIDVELVAFGGECTYNEVNRITSIIGKSNVDAIIGVGGGKLLDTVKYAAVKVDSIYSVAIPTLASNCAPWTPISVVYDEDGTHIGFDIHNKQLSLLLVEPNLIIDSPLDYFKAGIGDTIAKWYESDVLLAQDKHKNNAFLHMARAAALACKDNISNHSKQAIQDFTDGDVTEEVILLFETIISISGLVGGFGDKHARTTIAHDVHDALTAYSATHRFLHGNKVAYGVFVQLAYENKWDETNRLTSFYNELDLPKSLNELDLQFSADEEFENLSHRITHVGNGKHPDYVVDSNILYESLNKLENHFNSEV